MSHISNNGIKLVIDRVAKEYDELRRKTGRLESTVANLDKNNSISEEHKVLLKGQLSVMYQYLDILERRLKLFEQALESNDIPKEFDKKFNF